MAMKRPRLQTGRYSYLAAVAIFLAVTVTLPPSAQCRRLGELCADGRGEWDKWFDGCQWCVCTPQGVKCSRSDCDGLVKKVPPCSLVGQRWSDGCYKCRCRRNGITCRVDTTCLLLRHHPVPCLADERCVCGPDGVPSCTAEVIDRHAFSAHRLDLSFPEVRYEYAKAHDHDSAHRRLHKKGNLPTELELSRTATEDLAGFQDNDGGETSEELLIMSDNLCRFGSRWYGGSLRCFCDIDGAITCGNPSVVTAFIDNFSVQRMSCEAGHAWEDGCSICSCRIDPVVFCQRTRDCRQSIPDDSRSEVNFDHYLPVDVGVSTKLAPELSSASKPEITSSPATTTSTIMTTTAAPSCTPGKHWRQGCARCTCSDDGRQISCDTRDCNDPQSGDKLHHHHLDLQHEVKLHHSSRRANNDKPDVADISDDDKEDKNVVSAPDPTIHRRPRGPMMVPPKVTSLPRGYPNNSHKDEPCGSFRVGDKYWKDCNLCLCTNKGPKCTAKNCR